MGDMADDALNEMMDTDEEQQRLIGMSPYDLSDMEREFMQDYDGTMYPLVFQGWRPRK